MSKRNGIDAKVRRIFGIILGAVVFSQLMGILGVLGIGHTVVNIVVGIIILVIIAVMISKAYKIIKRDVLTPLGEIENALQQFGKGDLDVEIKYSGDDELGQVADGLREVVVKFKVLIEDITYIIEEFKNGNFNVRSEHRDAYVGDFSVLLEELAGLTHVFSDTMRNIDRAAEQVSAGSNDLASSSQDLAQGATDQAAVVQELLATVTVVTDQVLENTKATEQAGENAKSIGEQAEISKEKMTELTEAMESIKVTSGEIEKIIVDIEEIASQTNLLSLNAAIEAARAGEAGRGFAVVADQIRKLAEDSAASAVSTKQLIDKSIEEIQKGNAIAEDTAVTLNHVIDEMEKIVVAVENIRDASEQQAISVKEIETSVEQINGVIQNNSAAAEETSATSEELSAQAITLKQLVEQFQLRQN